jgi:NAD(P)-dependent dehydrogenase (short-subunit alcohol dehydrogenase family)
MPSVTKHVGYHAYSLSKAAVNFLVKDYAAELADEGFTVIAMNPGVRNVWMPF